MIPGSAREEQRNGRHVTLHACGSAHVAHGLYAHTNRQRSNSVRCTVGWSDFSFFNSTIIFNGLFVYFFWSTILVKTKIFKVKVKGQCLERPEDARGQVKILKKLKNNLSFFLHILDF